MIRTEVESRGGGKVARVTVDNPKKLNILSRDALRGLVSTFASFHADPGLRAVVVTGAGEKSFIGGADLDALGSLDPRSARDFITLVHEACDAMRQCPVPVVARINGYCLGAGLELAACCDLRIASDNAVFGMPEVRLGIPSVVEAAVLPRLIGAGRARWLVMTAENIDAAEALSWGLIEKIFKTEKLEQETSRIVDALLAAEPESLKAQKRLCKLWEEAPLSESVRRSIDEFAASYEGGVPNRLVAEFRAKRKKP